MQSFWNELSQRVRQQCGFQTAAARRRPARHVLPRLLEVLETRQLLSGEASLLSLPDGTDSAQNPLVLNVAPPLPAAEGTVVYVTNETELRLAARDLVSGTTVVLAPGTYDLKNTVGFKNVSQVTFRGATDNPDDVIIVGKGMNNPDIGDFATGIVPYGFYVQNVSGFTIANLTLRDFYVHGIILNGSIDAPHIYNVRFLDIGQQMIKSNPDTSPAGGATNGLVEFCSFEYTTTAPGTYTNGIDVHHGTDWIIRDNVFQNIRSPQGQELAGPAILMWNASQNTITERNLFLNCQRGIAYGLGQKSPFEQLGGRISDNIFYRSADQSGDVGITLNNSPDTHISNNIVLLNGTYPNAIEYRFALTQGVQISGNYTDAGIVSRTGGVAVLSENVTSARSSWFVNPAAGDFRLAPLLLDVSDFNSATNRVSEGAQAQTLVGITAGNPGGLTLTYSLADDPAGRFAIDPVTGVVSVANGALIDFETSPLISLTIQATAPSGQSVTKAFTIAVLNVIPTIPVDAAPNANQVVEGAPTGTPVEITAFAFEPGGTQLTYSLLNSSNGRFAIHPVTGVVTVANSSLINFEALAATSITVRVADGSGGSTQQTFPITILNAPPAIPVDMNSLPNIVAEGALLGTATGLQVRAVDPNGGAIVTYRLLDNAGGRFSINSSTGVVHVARSDLLNYEDAPRHTVTVEASDGRGGRISQNFTIDIRNLPPTKPVDIDTTFGLTNKVIENAAANTLVGITARSSDINGSPITYSLTNDPQGRFAIHPDTGVVTVARGDLINFESARSHTITIQAWDSQGGVSFQNFVVNVLNAMPTAPVDTNLADNWAVVGATVGTEVGITAFATDPASPASDVSYRLAASAGGRFAIDRVSGVVTVASSSLILLPATYTITVTAFDAYGGVAHTNFSISILSVAAALARQTTSPPVSATLSRSLDAVFARSTTSLLAT